MSRGYQGHRSKNAWNVSLWLFNDRDLYRSMRETVRSSRNLDAAARTMLEWLPERTPDGAPYNYSNVRDALRFWDR